MIGHLACVKGLMVHLLARRFKKDFVYINGVICGRPWKEARTRNLFFQGVLGGSTDRRGFRAIYRQISI